MKLIIIIPAYNEEKTIGEVIRDIPKTFSRVDDLKIFVINDGSKDKTSEIALQAGAHKIISNKKNLGLAKTFQNGLNAALSHGADIIVNIDSDGQYESKEIEKIIEPIIKKKVDMVIGDRQIKKLKFMKKGNKYGNILGSWVLRKLTGSNIKDASSGFRGFSRTAALKLNIYFDHTYTHETIIQAAYNDIAVTNVPIIFKARSAGKSRLIHSLFKHIKNSGLIIIRTILLYKPLKTLFYLGSIIAIPGIILGLKFVYLYLSEGENGKIQSLILASMLIMLGFFIILLGLIGDLIARNRKLNENILYQLKK